ncbi:hypothetical protein B0H17DRAFT_1212401 [Mycena rosella]|uniref:Uncharacterized protein n=1 Tax=Mycena rosella TaxID=1033263 RepID=A0AAD7CSN6_MYCRO|nr:hypothetical protein B0H17DRAFT_1212401 [Mycena rosella]
MSAPVETAFSLQEVCDEVTYHIAQDASSRNDLNSTALVCQRLCFSAQSHLFRHIILDPYQLPAEYLHTPDSALAAAASAFHHLSAVLTSSPHLLRHIRQLSVLAQHETLVLVSRIHFPFLRTIQLDFCDTLWPDEDALHLARDLIGLPSIREVKVIGGTAPPKLFPALFETCSRDLHSLAFIRLFPGFPFPTISVPRPSRGRPQIKRLKLISAESKGLEDWFISPSCPFDFTNLVELEWNSRHSTPLHQILSSARLGITRLAILSKFIHHPNLSEFPALTCLEIYYSNHESISSLAPDNCLETIVLRVEVSAFHGRFGSHGMAVAAVLLSKADAVVATTAMPALQQVEPESAHAATMLRQGRRLMTQFFSLIRRAFITDLANFTAALLLRFAPKPAI